MKFSSLLCLLLFSLGLNSALTVAAELDYQAPPLDNPGKGLVPYPGSSSSNRFPHSLEFSYFALKDVLVGQSAEGKYLFDWSRVNAFLETAKGRGNQGIFRIYSEYPGNGISIPQFLIDQGVAITELSYGNQTAWTPDYGNALLLQALQGTIAALGAQYDGDPRVDCIELGLLGVWGEWHNYGQPAYGADAATQGAVLQAYEGAFSTTKLLARYPRGADKGAAANFNRKVGYHDDSFAWSTLGTEGYKFMQQMTDAGALEKWKTQTIGGELYPQLNHCMFEETCSENGTEATNFLQTVEATHATYMRIEGIFESGVSEARIGQARAAVRRMGYDLHLSQATISPEGNNFTVTAKLKNRGVAPFYYNWPVTVGLVDTTGATIQEWPVAWRIDGLIPGEERDFSATLTPSTPVPAGARVALRVPNPMSGGHPLRFSNFNQQLDGQTWMILGGADGQAPPAAAAVAPKKVLFIRGGVGTVGFFENGSDEHGSDAFNYATNGGNHGWGELNAALVAEGFKVEQLAENPVIAKVPTPIPLDTMNLSQYSVIVFGSNNAEYTPVQVDAFMNYIGAGGSALFVSDANFGQNFGDAPSSDQYFLTRFGLTMNQDGGTYSIRRANEFVIPTHAILNRVNEFDGEGVSPLTRGPPPTGVSSTLLTRARFNVNRNTGAAQGPSEPATANDGSLVVATFGAGRVAGSYDRNTFFNENGAGTSITHLDNEAYARNLFNWLAGNPTATTNYAPRGYFPNLLPGSSVSEGVGFPVNVNARDPDGSVSSVSLKIDGAPISTDTTAPYEFSVPGLAAGNRTLTATVTDNLGATTNVNIAVNVINAGDVEQPLDRSGWILSATNNTGDLAKAIDGDIDTRWTTQQFQQPGQKFSIDFGQRSLFQRIVLETPNDPNDYPRSYVVRASDNGTNFVVIASGAGNNATTDIFLPAPVTYRYLEIEQTGSSASNWWSIHEINIYHPPANATLPLTSWLQFYYQDSPPSLLDDGDGDGLSTLEEYAFNSNPLSASPNVAPSAVIGIDPSDQGRLIDYTFRRWTNQNVSDVNYVIEASRDLLVWSSANLNLQFPFPAVPNGNGTESVTARIKFAGNIDRVFIRLSLIKK